MTAGAQVVLCPICHEGVLKRHCETSRGCDWAKCRTTKDRKGCGAVLDIAARRGWRQHPDGKFTLITAVDFKEAS